MAQNINARICIDRMEKERRKKNTKAMKEVLRTSEYRANDAARAIKQV